MDQVMAFINRRAARSDTEHSLSLRVFTYLCVGLGTINWPAAIHALDAIGYQGPAMVEGTRIASKTSKADDWQKSVSMCIDNYRAAEALVAEVCS